MIDFELLREEAARHPYPLLFATVSGAHLYGFPSPDSDYDLRGAHILPAHEALGFLPKTETIAREGMRGNIELDLVTHDAGKFFTMLLKRNGYVLEQLYSPVVVHAAPEHGELKEIAKGCITRRHSHHYLGFAKKQWDLFQNEDPVRLPSASNGYSLDADRDRGVESLNPQRTLSPALHRRPCATETTRRGEIKNEIPGSQLPLVGIRAFRGPTRNRGRRLPFTRGTTLSPRAQ
jgi:hypothetical protein